MADDVPMRKRGPVSGEVTKAKRKRGRPPKPKRPEKRRKLLSESEKVQKQYEGKGLVGRPLGWSTRPNTPEDFEEFERMCKIHCTPDEIANIFDCSKQTLYDHVSSYYSSDFPTVYEAKKAGGKMSLRRAQFKKALEGDSNMLKWLGKQYLGQNDTIIKDETRQIIYQTRIGPNGNIIQEIKTNDDIESLKTFDARGLLGGETNVVDVNTTEAKTHVRRRVQPTSDGDDS